MSCLTEDRLVEMLDGRGLDAARPAERTHLAACEACQDAWGGLAATAEVLSGARPARVRRLWLLLPVAAAAVVLFAVLGFVLARSEPPPPPPPATSELVDAFLRGDDEAGRLLALRGRSVLPALLDARRRAEASGRAQPLHALIYAAKRAGQADDPASRKLHEALDSVRVTIDMQRAPLDSLRGYLAEVTGLNILLDDGLPEAVRMSSIDLTLQDLRMRDILDLACTVKDLDYDLRYGVVFISSPRRLWRGEGGAAEGVLPLANRWASEPPSPQHEALVRKLRTMTVDLSFTATRHADIRGFMQELAGINFVLDPSGEQAVRERAVTVSVKNLTLDRILELLTLPYGLDARLQNGAVVLVGPRP